MFSIKSTFLFSIIGLFLPVSTFASGLPKEKENEFHFVILGDSQFHDPAKFNRVVDQTKLLMPAFVIQVGDLIQGYNNDLDSVDREWSRFKKQIEPLEPIPFLPVPGNHDVYNARRQVDPALEELYESHWGDLFKSFTYKNSEFFLINTDSLEGKNEIGSKQLNWLEEQLKLSRGQHKFAFMHRPALLLKNTENVHQLFLRYGVSHVFYGHHHHYHQIVKDGIQYSMTNAAANLAHSLPEAGGFHQLLQVSVSDEKVRVAVITADSIQDANVVSAQDNYDLFTIGRNLTKRKVALEPLRENEFKLELKFNNKSKRKLLLRIECYSEDNRWLLNPIKIAPLELDPDDTSRLNINAKFDLKREPESTPECKVHIPFQTQSGQWLDINQQIKTFIKS